MKNLFIFIMAFFMFSISAHANVNVNGYYKSNGKYVEPHYRSNPNKTTDDNWSTKGNQNPYTGVKGTKEPNNYTNPYHR